MHTPPEGFEIVSIVEYGNSKYFRHRVGAPSAIRESATRKEVVYGQFDHIHRTGGPAYFFIDKASGVVAEEEWYRRGSKASRRDAPHTTLRDRATGAIIEQRTGFTREGKRTTGPWHIDPDYLSIPDKPTRAKDETERHFQAIAAIAACGFLEQGVHARKQHRDGNLPAVIHRDGGGTRHDYYLDGIPARTDGGPTTEHSFPVREPGETNGVFRQLWEGPIEIPGQGVQFRHHREGGPYHIVLAANGVFTEQWGDPATAHQKMGQQMRWTQTQIEQGGPLWVPPAQRYPDGPNGPSQVLIHPDTGVRWYEARHNATGQLDRADGPAQVIRDQKTGKPLFVAHYKDGLPHNEHGPAVQVFDPKTGACTREEWARNGQPYEPTPEDKIRWAAAQREGATRENRIKAAAAAARANTPRAKATDRGDER
jgi:hypothetical protein